MSYVIKPGYPKELKHLDTDDLREFSRKREVSLNGEGKSGNFYSQKLDRIIQYESSLEMKFLTRLEGFCDIAFYQEQPVRIPYESQGRMLFYYPDVIFMLKSGEGIIAEIKPVFHMALQGNLIKWSALKSYCSQRDLGMLITDGRYSIQQIQQFNIKPEFADYVLNKLREGTIDWMEYKKIKEMFNPCRNDFVALVLKNKLRWRLSPFNLSL